MLKKIISTILIASTVLTMATPIYAAESANYIEPTKDFVKPKIEKAVPFAPNEDDLSKDVVKEASLYNVDSMEVLAVTSNTADTAIAVSLDKSYYEYLSAGEEVWYKFQTVESPGYQGTYDVFTTGSTDTYGQLYKKDSNGNMVLIDSNDDSGDGNNFKFVYYLNGSTVYYVKVRGYSSSTTGSFYFTAKRHVDQMSSSIGGSWTPSSGSPNPIVNGMVYKRTYLTISNTRALYSAYQTNVRDVILDYCVGEAASYAIPKITALLGVTSVQAMTIYTIFKLGSDVANAAMGSSIWNASNGIANGILITTENVDGWMCYNIESWTGSMIYGEPGYIGNFDTSDYEIGI